MARLMVSAGINPTITAVRSGEAELNRITGAKTPSGVPVVIAVPTATTDAERSRRATAGGTSSSARGRRGRAARGGSAGKRRAA
jgi:hypothetical protein